jgi:GWxTD domain-containing protein
MRAIAAMFFTVVLGTMSVYGQPRNMGRDEPGGMAPFLFFEAVNLISPDSSHSRLDIHYRIDKNFFVAVKNRDTSSTWTFMSRGEVLIELFDSLEVSRSRSIQRVEIGADRSDREPAGKTWYQDIASFELPPGLYKIVFEIDDLESERRFVDDKTTVRLKRFSSSSHETSTPLFIDWRNGKPASQSVTLIGFGPHLLFGRKAALYIELPSLQTTTRAVRGEYTVSTTSDLNRSKVVVLAETLTNILSFPKVKLEGARGADGVKYTISSNDSSRALGVLIPLASEKLPLRRFDVSVTIKLEDAEFKATKAFQMVWPDMPFSLRDIDNALTALKYITTEEQRDSLRHGDLEERRDHLEAFWKRKDTTPETAYNEVMVEYYRRVDHATRTFGTLRAPDGFKSDRGKVYILYGPPTKTERTLSPSTWYQEEWTYSNLGKRFIFADQTKNGNYVLISTQSL